MACAGGLLAGLYGEVTAGLRRWRYCVRNHALFGEGLPWRGRVYGWVNKVRPQVFKDDVTAAYEGGVTAVSRK